MVLEANRDLVLRRLTECLARDRTRHQVAEVTSLGLVQMTRKRVGGGLLEHFSTPCEHCRGRGVIVNAEPVGGTVQIAPRPERFERPERETRRARGGRRREGEERNGHDVRKPEPVAVGSGNGGGDGGGARNGSRAETVTADASVDVGAPAPVVTPAVLDAAPTPPAPPEAPPAEPAAPTSRRVRRSVRRGTVETSPGAGPVDVAADAVEEVVVERSVAAAHARPEQDTAGPAITEPAAAESTAAESLAAQPTAAQPTAAEPTAAQPTAAESTAAESTAAESPAAQPTATRPTAVERTADTPDEPAAAEGEPEGRARRRRGRVTRTAGAPTTTAGDAPVAAVVTVPSTAESTGESTAEPTAVPVAAPPQPEPGRRRPPAAGPAGGLPAGGPDPPPRVGETRHDRLPIPSGTLGILRRAPSSRGPHRCPPVLRPPSFRSSASMYAIVKTGGKQYKVAVDDVVTVEKIDGEPGAEVSLPAVLLVDGDDVTTDAAALAVGLGDGHGGRAHQGPEDPHPQVQEQDRVPQAAGPPSAADQGPGHRHLAVTFNY